MGIEIKRIFGEMRANRERDKRLFDLNKSFGIAQQVVDRHWDSIGGPSGAEVSMESIASLMGKKLILAHIGQEIYSHPAHLDLVKSAQDLATPEGKVAAQYLIAQDSKIFLQLYLNSQVRNDAEHREMERRLIACETSFALLEEDEPNK